MQDMYTKTAVTLQIIYCSACLLCQMLMEVSVFLVCMGGGGGGNKALHNKVWLE